MPQGIHASFRACICGFYSCITEARARGKLLTHMGQDAPAAGRLCGHTIALTGFTASPITSISHSLIVKLSVHKERGVRRTSSHTVPCLSRILIWWGACGSEAARPAAAPAPRASLQTNCNAAPAGAQAARTASVTVHSFARSFPLSIYTPSCLQRALFVESLAEAFALCIPRRKVAGCIFISFCIRV